VREQQAYQCAAVTASRADFRSFSCRFFGGAVEIVAVSMQTGPRSPIEAQLSDLVGKVAPESPAAPQRPAPSQPVPKAAQTPHARPAPRSAPVVEEPVAELELHAEPEALELIEPVPGAANGSEFGEEFDINRLSPEEQELHRRANRVAKVSMQDIKCSDRSRCA